jgi:hypothetical protein
VLTRGDEWRIAPALNLARALTMVDVNDINIEAKLFASAFFGAPR